MARSIKTTYIPEIHLVWISAMARKGYTLLQMAEEMGISDKQLNRWVSANPALRLALKENRSYADSMVERSLYNRAIGMTIKEKKVVKTTSKNGEESIKEEEYEKEIPPDTTACVFWLKNRRPAEWRDTHTIDASVEDLTPLADLLGVED